MSQEQRKTAVAIEYEPGEVAPKIIASGKGFLADKIVEAAKQENVPVHQDIPLANTLSKLEIVEFIPQELYEVVAEVLTFVDSCDNLKRKLSMKK